MKMEKRTKQLVKPGACVAHHNIEKHNFFLEGPKMKHTKKFQILIILSAAIFCFGHICLAGPVGTAFTYQGRLIDANKAADGEYDFQFKLYDANSDGNKLGTDVNKPEVDVIDGYFTVELDFGTDPNLFNGNERWLDIGVRPGDLNDPNVYTTLSPRQEITPAPYALYTMGGGGAGGSPWQMNGSDIYYNAGNVGIGTTTPSSPLTINTVAGPDIELVSTGSNADIMTNGAFRVGTSTSQPFSIITNNIYQMTVDSAGNVGIGTTTPSDKLSVYGGTIRATNSDPNGRSFIGEGGLRGGVFSASSASGVGVFGWASHPSEWNAGGYFGTDSSNGVGIHCTSSGDYAGGIYTIASGQAGTGIFSSASHPNGVTHAVWGVCSSPNGYAGYFTGGRNYFQGNVGIGTTNPAAKLEVNGDISTTSNYKIGDINVLSASAYNIFVGQNAGVNNSTGNYNIFVGGYAGIDNNTGSWNTFIGNGAGALNYTGSKNTFLGAYAGNSNTTGGSNVFLGYRAGYNETGSNKLYIANSWDNPPLIYGDFGTGNVGIRTTTPARNLHINDVMRLQPRATEPSSPAMGDIYMDSTQKKLMVYDGTTWQACW
jgi:hypothetical protein